MTEEQNFKRWINCFLAGDQWEVLDCLVRFRVGGMGCWKAVFLSVGLGSKVCGRYWKWLVFPAAGDAPAPSVRCTAPPGSSPGLPGEVLLQRHHLPPAPQRRRPLPSLRTQMSFDLRLQISALLDRCRRCSCRQRQQFSQLIPLVGIPVKVCGDAEHLFRVVD